MFIDEYSDDMWFTIYRGRILGLRLNLGFWMYVFRISRKIYRKRKHEKRDRERQ